MEAMGCINNYTGTPCAVILCVDSCEGQIRGILYHAYSLEGIPFSGLERAFLEMEHFYDRLQFPFPGTEDRSFLGRERKCRKERMARVMGDEELLKKHGEAGTFIIRVQHRQHSSWQGIVTWVDQQKTVPFRSALELMKMIDEVLQPEDTEREGVSFFDGEEQD